HAAATIPKVVLVAEPTLAEGSGFPGVSGGLALLLGVLLWRVLHGAPLTELSGDQDFQLFLQRNLEFTRKIRGDVAALQRMVVSPTCCGGEMAATCDTLQLCNEDELLLVRQDLDITQVPLEQCHKRTFQAVSQLCHSSGHPRAPCVLVARPLPAPLTMPCPPQETCFSQIRAGLRIYHGSLATIQALLPGHTGLVETLQLDMANLSSNIQQQMEDLGLATVMYPTENQDPLPTFSSNFHHQVGGFFILANFQRFLETAYRALRHLTNL
ncbi:hypothetical protein IHE44_0010303, partial [Lamprotornis superbus]